MEMTKRELDTIIQQVNLLLTEFTLGVVDLVTDDMSLEEFVSKNKMKTKDNLKTLEEFIKDMCK